MAELIFRYTLLMHIAFILDGNRRWAKQHGVPVFMGHKKGAENLKNLFSLASKYQIKVITVYALSTENMKRDQKELKSLFSVMTSFVNDALFFSKQGIRFQWLGKPEGLPASLISSLRKRMQETEQFDGVLVQAAINYGGRDEIIRAVQNISGEVTESSLEKALDTSMQPDLLIRTGGNKRISNFLLWQMAYTDLYFTEKLWPEFEEEELKKALQEWDPKERRFGK